MESFEVLPFFRGVSEGFPVDAALIRETRRDRLPRNTDLKIHAMADSWFEKRFGIKYRSQALIVTSCRFTARGYAASDKHVVRVIPLGPYKYCWSRELVDMLSISLGSPLLNGIEDILDRAGYVESDLAGAHNTRHEVMLFCEKYVAIPVHLLEGAIADDEAPPAIILGSK